MPVKLPSGAVAAATTRGDLGQETKSEAAMGVVVADVAAHLAAERQIAPDETSRQRAVAGFAK